MPSCLGRALLRSHGVSPMKIVRCRIEPRFTRKDGLSDRILELRTKITAVYVHAPLQNKIVLEQIILCAVGILPQARRRANRSFLGIWI